MNMEERDVRLADPGDLQLVCPASVAISQARDLAGPEGLVCRLRLGFIVSGVRPRAIEWLGLEWESRTDGVVIPLRWAGTSSEQTPIDETPKYFHLVTHDDDDAMATQFAKGYFVSSVVRFEPMMLGAYASIAMNAQFVASPPVAALQPGAHRITIQAQLTGEGGAKRTLEILDVEVRAADLTAGGFYLVDARRAVDI
jgi:hypothetical protein